jgi:hypothetical protein
MTTTTDMTHAELAVGNKLSHGRVTVIDCTKEAQYVKGGLYSTWTALCVCEDDYMPYVVWTIIARPEGFVRESGEYSKTLKEAMAIYDNRRGR